MIIRYTEKWQSDTLKMVIRYICILEKWLLDALNKWQLDTLKNGN